MREWTTGNSEALPPCVTVIHSHALSLTFFDGVGASGARARFRRASQLSRRTRRIDQAPGRPRIAAASLRDVQHVREHLAAPLRHSMKPASARASPSMSRPIVDERTGRYVAVPRADPFGLPAASPKSARDGRVTILLAGNAIGSKARHPRDVSRATAL
jgi:hypothetical protein